MHRGLLCHFVISGNIAHKKGKARKANVQPTQQKHAAYARCLDKHKHIDDSSQHTSMTQHTLPNAGKGSHLTAHMREFPAKMTGRSVPSSGGKDGESARNTTRKDLQQGSLPHACCTS